MEALGKAFGKMGSIALGSLCLAFLHFLDFLLEALTGGHPAGNDGFTPYPS
jgi:hypothetical protein